MPPPFRGPVGRDRFADQQGMQDENKVVNAPLGGPSDPNQDPISANAPGPTDPRVSYAYTGTEQVGNSMPKGFKGSPSLMNEFALVRFDALQNPVGEGRPQHNALLDIDGMPGGTSLTGDARWRDARPSTIVEWAMTRDKPNMPFLPADFMWLKYLDIIPCNYLVTLRRYPIPILDSAKVIAQDAPDHVVDGQEVGGKYVRDVARALTFFGPDTGNPLSELLGMEMQLKWASVEADVQDIEPDVGMGATDQAGPGGRTVGLAKGLGLLTGQANFSTISGQAEQMSKYNPWNGGSLANRVYGPVNVVTSTMKRDRGLEFSHDITLKFHYHAAAVGAINPKVAMLEIIANLLSLTYNNAAFWGGAIRYHPNVPQYPFLGGAKGWSAWLNGDPVGFFKSVRDQMGDAAAGVENWLGNMLSSPMDAIRTLLKGGAGMWMAGKQYGNRPQILYVKALLTGEPVGEWHLTIGNPMNPIAMIGNLVCKSMKLEFNDQLSGDDFPTELTATITLGHGRPRDKGDVESIFNAGGGRLYYAYKGSVEPWNTASSTQNSNIDDGPMRSTHVDTSWRRSSRCAAGCRDAQGRVPFEGDPRDVERRVRTGREVPATPEARAAWQLAERWGFKHAGEDTDVSDQASEKGGNSAVTLDENGQPLPGVAQPAPTAAQAAAAPPGAATTAAGQQQAAAATNPAATATDGRAVGGGDARGPGVGTGAGTGTASGSAQPPARKKASPRQGLLQGAGG